MSFWLSRKICNEKCYRTWERAGQINWIYNKSDGNKSISYYEKILKIELHPNSFKKIIDNIEIGSLCYIVRLTEKNAHKKNPNRPWLQYQNMRGLISKNLEKPPVNPRAKNKEIFNFHNKKQINDFILDLD